ncbi:hypothetical protein LLH00_14970 [bacterium]|nr:hypothetical protein [bacterium]
MEPGKRVKFGIDLEFEQLGGGADSEVLVTCPQLNVQTVGGSFREAARRMGEALAFFFENTEQRGELEEALEALRGDRPLSAPEGLL